MAQAEQSLEAPLSQGDPQAQAAQQAISDLSNARSALRWLEQRYFVLVQSLEEGVVMIDAHGRLLTVNEAAHELVGDSGELVRWLWGDDPYNRLEGIHPATETLADGRPRTGVEMRVERPAGVARWLRVNARALLDTDSRSVGAVLCTFSDISEFKRLESALRRQSIQDRDTGVYNRSHLQMRLVQEIDRAQRSEESLSFALVAYESLDADGAALDEAGRERVARRCAECLPLHLRAHDVVGSWDSHRLGVILPGAEQASAEAAMRRCVVAISAIRRDREGELPALGARAAVTQWRPGMIADTFVAATVDALAGRPAQS